MQTKKQSLTEIITSVAIGYFVALFSQFIIFPLMGYDVPMSHNIIIGLWFTGVSVARGYAVRRFFNWFHRCKHENCIVIEKDILGQWEKLHCQDCDKKFFKIYAKNKKAYII